MAIILYNAYQALAGQYNNGYHILTGPGTHARAHSYL